MLMPISKHREGQDPFKIAKTMNIPLMVPNSVSVPGKFAHSRTLLPSFFENERSVESEIYNRF